MYFKPRVLILKFNILYLRIISENSNISMYLSFAMHLPEDSYMSGRNM
jgi:hypothetical protein